MLTSNKWATWIGYGLSGLVILFMLFDGSIKLLPLEVVITTMPPWPGEGEAIDVDGPWTPNLQGVEQ